MRIGTLPDGSLGFDCNTPVSTDVARRFFDAGYRFVVRYVPRVTTQSHDLSAAEMINILLGGLAVSVVQHVALPGWKPDRGLGTAYGRTAATEARVCGYPQGSTLWCDLEGVSAGSTKQDVIDYSNAWYDQVLAAGYEPGEYVGDSCVLSAEDLYHKTRFARFWSAYNCNADQIPVVRGVQMRQRAYPAPGKRVAGVAFEYDENVIKADALGSSPLLLIP